MCRPLPLVRLLYGRASGRARERAKCEATGAVHVQEQESSCTHLVHTDQQPARSTTRHTILHLHSLTCPTTVRSHQPTAPRYGVLHTADASLHSSLLGHRHQPSVAVPHARDECTAHEPTATEPTAIAAAHELLTLTGAQCRPGEWSGEGGGYGGRREGGGG